MKKRYIVISVVILIIITIYAYLTDTPGESHRKVYSPDLQYSVYALKYRYEKYIPKFPGQGSDASGKIYLYDEVEKKVLESGHIPMVWMIGDIEWSEDRAYFKGDSEVDWKLPRKVKMPYRVEYPDNAYKVFSPFGELHEEGQFIEINGEKIQSYMRFYDKDNNITIEHLYKYFTENKNNENDPWYVVTSRFYEKGKLYKEYQRQAYRQINMDKRCGVEKNFDRETGEVISEIKHGDCYQ